MLACKSSHYYVMHAAALPDRALERRPTGCYLKTVHKHEPCLLPHCLADVQLCIIYGHMLLTAFLIAAHMPTAMSRDTQEQQTVSLLGCAADLLLLTSTPDICTYQAQLKLHVCTLMHTG